MGGGMKADGHGRLGPGGDQAPAAEVNSEDFGW